LEFCPRFSTALPYSIIDSAGNTTIAPLFYVSPDQVDFRVPATVASGLAKVVVDSSGVNQTAANVQISAVAPALFTLNNSGLAASYAVRVSAGGGQTVEQVYSQDNTGLISANPINLGSSTDQVYLILYGTGFDTAGTSNVMATVNGVSAPVLYARPGGSAGQDQVNILLPASLAGTGNLNVQLTAAGIAANPVQITIQQGSVRALNVSFRRGVRDSSGVSPACRHREVSAGIVATAGGGAGRLPCCRYLLRCSQIRFR